jgi:hypothetical protein
LSWELGQNKPVGDFLEVSMELIYNSEHQ